MRADHQPGMGLLSIPAPIVSLESGIFMPAHASGAFPIPISPRSHELAQRQIYCRRLGNGGQTDRVELQLVASWPPLGWESEGLCTELRKLEDECYRLHRKCARGPL